MDKNIRPGVCGICGTAVVQPEKEESGWHSGHLYKKNINTTEMVLTMVRCMSHKEKCDPRHYDKDGCVVETCDIEDPRFDY
jgi:hypothetical protein